MKLTTVTGKKPTFTVTQAIKEQFKRYMVYQFNKRIAEGRIELEAAQMAQLSVCYLVGEVNDSNFAPTESVLDYLIEENNYIGA